MTVPAGPDAGVRRRREAAITQRFIPGCWEVTGFTDQAGAVVVPNAATAEEALEQAAVEISHHRLTGLRPRERWVVKPCRRANRWEFLMAHHRVIAVKWLGRIWWGGPVCHAVTVMKLLRAVGSRLR